MSRPSWKFDRFVFDTATGELRTPDSVTRLEPQPAKVLAVLLERQGEVVPRAALRDAVWPSDTFVDFERGLTYCVAQVRTALGDSASAPRFVETLPRRGYRFIASATAVADTVGAAASTESAVAPPVPWSGTWRPGSRRFLAAALGLLLAVAVVLMVARRPAAGRPLVAVVPFDNETGIAANDRAARQLSDAVVVRLAAHAERLGVIGNAAVLQRARTFRDLHEIRDALHVRFVVFGQVQRAGDRCRILVHLVRADDETHVWAHPYDAESDDPLTLERVVVGAVERAVLEHVAP